jgi:hypothetical protein
MAEAEHQGNVFYNDIEPETSIRIQDQTMVDWLIGMRFRQQTPRVVVGWQSKQFSQKKELQSDETQKTPMSYPMISLTVGTMVPDPTRRQFSKVQSHYRTGRIYIDEERKTLYSHPWPIPVTIPYQIDIYTKTRQDLRLLETALMCRFKDTDQTYLKARFPGYGELFLRLKWDRSDDTSELETGEKERELRKTVSTTMDGWIFLQPIKQRTIQNGHVVLIDAGSQTQEAPPDGNLLEDTAFMNWYNDFDHYHFSSSRKFFCTPNPSGSNSGPFTISISPVPLLTGSTTSLVFTIGGVQYTETAIGTGAFTNLNAKIAASNVNYTTGAVTVTFTTPPDFGTKVRVSSSSENPFQSIASVDEDPDHTPPNRVLLWVSFDESGLVGTGP